MNERAGSEASEVETETRRVSRSTDKRSRDKTDKGKRQNACGNRDKNEQMRRYRVLGTNSIRLSFSLCHFYSRPLASPSALPLRSIRDNSRAR